MIESKQLNHDVRSRLTMLERLQVETEACQLERSEALTINETLRRNLSQYKVGCHYHNYSNNSPGL